MATSGSGCLHVCASVIHITLECLDEAFYFWHAYSPYIISRLSLQVKVMWPILHISQSCLLFLTDVKGKSFHWFTPNITMEYKNFNYVFQWIPPILHHTYIGCICAHIYAHVITCSISISSIYIGPSYLLGQIKRWRQPYFVSFWCHWQKLSLIYTRCHQCVKTFQLYVTFYKGHNAN